MACNIETIEKVDCRLVLTDASGNIAKEFDLANTDMSFNSYEFTIKDFKNEFIIPIADLSSINSGAYATFTDLYNFIAGERTDCICACGGGGGTTYTFQNGVEDIGGNVVELGGNGALTSLNINGSSGNGHIHMKHQSADPTTTGSSTTLFMDILGNLVAKIHGGFKAIFKYDGITADRTYTLQDGSGTLAFLSDIKGDIIRDIVGGTAVTGTTANTKCYSKLINGNTFLVSDIPRLFVQGEKVGTNSTSVMRLYFNTIDSLSGASFVGSISVSATQLSIGFERDFAVMSSTTIMILNTISANTTSTNTTQAPLTFTIDISLGQYLIVAFQNASASDSSNVKFVKLQ